MNIRNGLVVLTLSALALTGCGLGSQEDDNYVGVCMDPTSQVRVPDSQCNADGSSMNGFFWGYFLASSYMPGIGQRGSGYVRTYDTQRYNTYRGGVSTKGGYTDFKTYKPVASKVTNSSTSLSSSKWKTYDTKGNSKSGWGTSSGTSKGGTGTTSKKSGGSFGGGSKSSGGGFKSGGKR